MTVTVKNLIPRRDWVLVLCDARKEQVGGIFLPQQETGVEKVMERSGTVVRLGPGTRAEQIGVKEGDRIVFRGFLKEATPVPTDTNQDAFLMDLDDVIAVIDRDVEVGAFSRPAMHAVEKVDESGRVTMR